MIQVEVLINQLWVCLDLTHIYRDFETGDNIV